MLLTEDRPLKASSPKALYRHRTRVGAFYIAPCRGGWEVQHGGETLGVRRPSAEAALGDLIAGRTRLPSERVDPSTLGLATSLDEWERLGWVTGQPDG